MKRCKSATNGCTGDADVIDPSWVDLAWKVALTLAGLVGTVAGLWGYRRFASREEMQTVASTLQAHSTRLTHIETELRHAPKHSDLVDLRNAVADLRSGLSKLEGQYERTNNLLEAIHDHLLNDK